MFNSVIRMALLGVGAYTVFQNRYKILNAVLGNESVRSFLVSKSMDIPFVRNFFMQQAFKQQ